MRLPTENDHLAHVVFPSKDSSVTRLSGLLDRGSFSRRMNEPELIPKASIPREIKPHKGDGTRIPTTKGDESAKPGQREISTSL